MYRKVGCCHCISYQRKQPETHISKINFGSELLGVGYPGVRKGSVLLGAGSSATFQDV